MGVKLAGYVDNCVVVCFLLQVWPYRGVLSLVANIVFAPYYFSIDFYGVIFLDI